MVLGIGNAMQNSVLQDFACLDKSCVKLKNETDNCFTESFKSQSTSLINDSLDDNKENKSDDGLLLKIFDFISGLFKGDSKGQRSGIEIPIKSDGLIYYAEEPDTPEFNARNEYMEAKKAEWIKNHPEPEFNPYACCLNNPHFQWEQELQEYLDNLEATYREENPEYKAQALDYEDAKKRASIMM